MLVKFWGINQGGGDGDGSVNYLLNERVEQGTAKVLKGDANLTKSLLLSLTQKHKACVGCLSFEESNINDGLKYELMESFENALLTQEMQGRYNILWVEHTDKGRLELNFVIPKIDLGKQKAFNPYYHKVDLKRIDTWQNVVNLKYTFTNPKDLEKQQISNYHNTKTPQGKAIFKNYKELDNYLYNAVTQGLLNSRAEIIELLQASNYEITRQGKDYISVKLPNQQKAKRLKGIIYDERFAEQRLIEQELREYSQNKDTSRERDTREISKAPNTTPRATQSLIQELRDLEQQLHRHIEHKQRYYKKLHQSTSKDPREPKEQLPKIRDSQQRTQQKHANETTRARETNPQEPSQEILTNAPNFHYGANHHGGNISGDILSNYSTQQGQGIRAFTERSLSVKTRNRPTKQRQSTENLQPNTDQEIRGKNAERMLKYATECFNQRSRELAERERKLTASKEQQDSEFRERQKRAINQARESYSRISKAKQGLREFRDRNLKLERELRNATSNTQRTTKEISILRNDRESRIKASDTNLRAERNHAQKRFKGGLRADFNNRISTSRTQRAKDFTSSIQRIENTIRDFRNNAQARARTILHNIYARTRDTINAIKDIYRNAKERIRDFFQRADERLSKRMEQETRELHTKTTQLDRKIREHNQKIENERNYSRDGR
ncbi:relaxase/mobilization nuclease domain-containing protein [Helicobacter pylori]|uniref:relaxase/mobilization nuclease domain-containing protein n=3 Tax=Helicobacter pylori TaxID=210 RepID=UPI0019312B12|nr:relaxase/mobilization nuclease domain-containing protein [Helicobacter pylori]MBM0604719.1 relaxase/mobilization nuclease domain-containing protein [Helicobacter pylori]MBM0615184.1 relaxase/mobilization nuclease domain-containing protein [Helicobacter pylori]MBM0616654.1 relaxase/mobilization nuclease domain-containing protein [Helicobacter pylori]MBM0629142.1 relaxase/mobilization nuclease domain-containing protein [Helicobacter pylori]